MISDRLYITDEYGLDPLTPALDLIMDAPYVPVKITDVFAFRPGGIARLLYGTVEGAKMLQLYNGLVSASDFMEGTIIRVPDKTAIERIDASSPNSLSYAYDGEVVEL